MNEEEQVAKKEPKKAKKPKAPKEDKPKAETRKEQVGFYFIFHIPKEDGGFKKIESPQYMLMADHCFDQKTMCFDDSTSLKFDGKKWSWLTKTAFSSYIIAANKECIKPYHVDNFGKMIRGRCFISAMGIKTPESMINVNNGIIDVKTSGLIPHSYQYLFKYCAPVDFSQTAECPRWEQFLMEVFDKNIELIDLAQRLFGYILLGGRPFLHKAFVLCGSGRNGKSTFLDVLRAVIGFESYSTVSMAKLDKEFSVVAIDGKLANIVEETPSDEINAEVFKTLVGGGEIQASHKGFDEYKFRCNARFVFACNEMPIFKDKTVGLEERLVFIPFNRYFKESERDTSITEKLLEELPGILNWAVRGAKVISEERTIPNYEATNLAKEQYKIETNPIYAWFKEEIEIVSAPSRQVPVIEVYMRYRSAMEENGHRPFSKDKFVKLFRKYVQAECADKNIWYDADARDQTRKVRVFDVLNIKSHLADSQDSLFKSAGQNKWRGYN